MRRRSFISLGVASTLASLLPLPAFALGPRVVDYGDLPTDKIFAINDAFNILEASQLDDREKERLLGLYSHPWHVSVAHARDRVLTIVVDLERPRMWERVQMINANRSDLLKVLS